MVLVIHGVAMCTPVAVYPFIHPSRSVSSPNIVHFTGQLQFKSSLCVALFFFFQFFSALLENHAVFAATLAHA